MTKYTERQAPAETTTVLDDDLMNILSTLAAGHDKKVTAEKCLISGRTMRRKLAELRREWGVEHTIELVVMAVRKGLI